MLYNLRCIIDYVQHYTPTHLQGNIKLAAKILHIKTHSFLQSIWQVGTSAPLDQKRSHLGDLAKSIMLAQRPFQVARSAGTASTHAQSNHAAYHQEMPVTPVGK